MQDWRLNLTFRWIVNHQASNLGCGNELGAQYRPIHLPASEHPSHFQGVTLQVKARRVRSELVFPPGCVVTVVEGLLSKSPSDLEKKYGLVVPLLDNWFLIPNSKLPTSSSCHFLRGFGVGSFVRKATLPLESNVVFSHLPNEEDRVWMRCRETNRFHYIRPVACISTRYIDSKVYLVAKNSMTSPLMLTSLDRSKLNRLRKCDFATPPTTLIQHFTDPPSTLTVSNDPGPPEAIDDSVTGSSNVKMVTSSKHATLPPHRDDVSDIGANSPAFDTTCGILSVTKRPHSKILTHCALQPISALEASGSVTGPLARPCPALDASGSVTGPLARPCPAPSKKKPVTDSFELRDRPGVLVAQVPVSVNSFASTIFLNALLVPESSRSASNQPQQNFENRATHTLKQSSLLLMANHKRHRVMVDSLDSADYDNNARKVPRLRDISPIPEVNVVDGADAVDYEIDDFETDTPQTSQATYSESVVNAWSDFDVPRLKCSCAVSGLSTHVVNVVRHFFDTKSFEPMPGLFWSDLFSRDVTSNEVTNPETGELFHEFHNSTRATVPLFDWSRPQPHPKFTNFPLTQDCLDDLSAFRAYLLSTIISELGFELDKAHYNIRGMSILCQTAVGGISQVIHTDDNPDSAPGEWISLLFPCHTQRATVFLRSILSNRFGKPDGVKPLVNLGDVLAWTRVEHFGSAAQCVPEDNVLRVALFVYLQVSEIQPSNENPVHSFKSPVTGDLEDNGVNSDEEQEINYGPDIIHWTSGLVPIIRTCCSCLHGVNSFDFKTSTDSSNASPSLSVPENGILFCTICAQTSGLSTHEAVAQALVCQWCSTMEAFTPLRHKNFGVALGSNSVADFLYQSMLDAGLCSHGRLNYQKISVPEHLFVLFFEQEVVAACNFWLVFFAAYDFAAECAPIEIESALNKWSVFWDLFLLNTTCPRARVLCWIGAMIAGIGPVMMSKKKLYHGGYPVFYNSSSFGKGSSLTAFVNVNRTLRRACDLEFNEAQLTKVSKRVHSYVALGYWEYSMRCTCDVSHVSSETSSPNSANDHHKVLRCRGPILRRDVCQRTLSSENDKAVVDSFVQQCRSTYLQKL